MAFRGIVTLNHLAVRNQRKGHFAMGVILDILSALFGGSPKPRLTTTTTTSHATRPSLRTMLDRVPLNEILPAETIAKLRQSMPPDMFAQFEDGVPQIFLTRLERGGIPPQMRAEMELEIPADLIDELERALRQRASGQSISSSPSRQDTTAVPETSGWDSGAVASPAPLSPSRPEASIPQVNPWTPDAKITGDDPWHPGQNAADDPWHPDAPTKKDDPWHPGD